MEAAVLYCDLEQDVDALDGWLGVPSPQTGHHCTAYAACAPSQPGAWEEASLSCSSSASCGVKVEKAQFQSAAKQIMYYRLHSLKGVIEGVI